MSTLKNFIERRHGSYAAVEYDSVTQQHFADWLKQQKIPYKINPKKMHSTVIYSRKPIDEQRYCDDTVNWKFTATRFDVVESNSLPVLIIILDAPQLIQQHKKMLDAGATHDFDDYIPHVTASYNFKGDVASLTLPTFLFCVKRLYCEPLDLNWSDK